MGVLTVTLHQAVHCRSVDITVGILYFNEKGKGKTSPFYFLGIPKIQAGCPPDLIRSKACLTHLILSLL